MTKNLNWENSTKNLVTFKRWDGANDKKKLILWKFTETTIFLGCVCVCVCVGGGSMNYFFEGG